MKKQQTKTSPQHIEKTGSALYDKPILLILIAYAVVTVITPSFYALNSNGTKFLALALLNLGTFIYLLSRKERGDQTRPDCSFFQNKIGLGYAGLLAVMLLSFVKAINISESIVTFLTYFTVFAAAYNLSLILKSDKGYLRFLSIILSGLLLIDCFTVFYNIFLYISHALPSIYEIKSVYSNKNILTAAIFIKIPFALWLITYEKAWLRTLGFFAVFAALHAILYMSARSFYMGMIVLVVAYTTYLLLVYQREKTKEHIKTLVGFLGTVMLAFLLFGFVQAFLYPRTQDVYNESFAKRLATAYTGDASTVYRLDSWKHSGLLLKENPLLGVGAGNWKVRVLQYENPSDADFIFMGKAHNDFIEVTTESGLFGGLLFLSIFVFLILNFLRAFFKAGATAPSWQYLFLPAFGILCYSFDAFFNFPATRPEIQSLFVIFLGGGIAYSPASPKVAGLSKLWPKRIFIVLFMALMLTATYVLALNFQSLRLQRMAAEDLQNGTPVLPSSKFLEGFPGIPNLGTDIEPISVIKSRYLIYEKKYAAAIDILKKDVSNPYLSNREGYLMIAYDGMGNKDSALAYAWKTDALKPRHYKALAYICTALVDKGDMKGAEEKLLHFLSLEKSNASAWWSLTRLYSKEGQTQKALATIDSAAKYLPGDSAILNNRAKMHQESEVLPYQGLLNTAMAYFQKQNFPMALKYLDEYLSKVPNSAITYVNRAYCYHSMGQYAKCILDVERAMAGGIADPGLLNLRGLCYYKLGKRVEACADFRSAIERGNKEAVENAGRLCGERGG